jgi:deoxycytidine triphosphate deaminase
MAEYNPQYMWRIPREDEGAQGVLLSDRIRLYVDAVHLIEPDTFVAESLRPASYELHVGDVYYVDDKRADLNPNGQLEIPASGLVYIATNERFNVPYYMVARYSLTVTQVYRGLLIDNGLQIDAGYHGRIFIPVHNFTDEARFLSRGEPFLSIDFTRTTPLPQEVNSASTERHLLCLASTGKLKGADGNPVLLFTSNYKDLGKERTPEFFWNKRPGERHKSSLLGMDQRNRELSDATRRKVDRIQIIALGGFLALLLSLVSLILPWISRRYLDTELAVRPIEEKVKLLNRQLQEQRSPELKRLQERMDSLENEMHDLRSTGPGIPAATSGRSKPERSPQSRPRN